MDGFEYDLKLPVPIRYPLFALVIESKSDWRATVIVSFVHPLLDSLACALNFLLFSLMFAGCLEDFDGSLDRVREVELPLFEGMGFNTVFTEIQNEPHRFVEVACETAFIVDDNRINFSRLDTTTGLLILLSALIPT
ncbi:hypothetical protein Hlac_2772 [Halorubrum lacusprofundi ATCC 49239]|uniref:Uncharacterized protein n=1 Tax=Halorubrum lacusprofundi (strain ATCC 49239 / DSM 5036 / JCM 8891 / ACAM 34) TaxID=416348 RepID=B9LVV1_HALLT|nr:hypothetical protein Hlac_2772 [Halorubrum lacusprofundi ATCC 49239]